MNKYLDILAEAIDSFGLLVERYSKDGGDSANREGSLMCYAFFALKEGRITQQEFDEIAVRYHANYLRLREGCSKGEIRRHVDTTKWYGDIHRMSRDQWTANMIALGYVKQMKKERADMILGWAMRGFHFTTNTKKNWFAETTWKVPDITVLSCWNYGLRWSKFGWLMFPFIMTMDLDLLIGSLIWRARMNKADNKNFDVQQHTIGLLQAKYSVPTPISWLARKVLDPEKVLKCYYGYHHEFGPRLDLVAEDFLREAWK